MAGKLEGKVAIVTAGGAGIGAATVRRFAKEGAAVIIADLSGTRARAVNDEIKAAGGRAAFIKMDASDPEAIQASIKLALDSYGRLDILFNNAGMAEVGLLHDTTLESWNRVMAVTLTVLTPVGGPTSQGELGAGKGKMAAGAGGRYPSELCGRI
jgi:NAD(P)-dependent dehydrogenase (short-subunit alcohol dehydrogenase family)